VADRAEPAALRAPVQTRPSRLAATADFFRRTLRLLLIGGAVALHVGQIGEVAGSVVEEVRTSVNTPGFGFWGMLALLLHAYSLGTDTYTGIEAVSNSMPVMREPRVLTGKRTIIYMALSLSLVAGGLMLSYLLLGVTSGGNKTMNCGGPQKLDRWLGYKTKRNEEGIF
jgi:hypothetical protein